MQSYLPTENLNTYMPHCILYTHDTIHIFHCSQVLTLTTTSQWKNFSEAAEVIQEWESRLVSLRGQKMVTPQEIIGGGATTTTRRKSIL